VTADRTLIVAESRMDPALAELVHQTCAFTGVECRTWNGVDRLDDLAGRAALVIGVLPAGERRIPGPLAGLVTEQLPGLPLVLLARERLVRPMVSLEGGRVTLLESPLDPTLLASCARALLAETVPEQHGWWAAAASDGSAIDRREYRVGRAWVGVLDCDGSAGWSQRALPWLQTARENEPGLALAAMLTLADAGGQPVSRRAPDGDGAELALLGPKAALELHGQGDRPLWVFPPLAGSETRPGAAAGRGAVALYSAARLPAWTVLEQTAASRPIRLVAADGDLAVVVAPGLGWLDSLRSEASAGGPALLDAIEAELQHAPTPFSCLVVELA
jgi:hypothetical protein